MKIWAKLMVREKILRDIIYEDDSEVKLKAFVKALQEIAYRLDIATPVVIPTHFRHFEKFNRVKFLPRDFVEEVDYDCLILERVVERKKPTTYYI